MYPNNASNELFFYTPCKKNDDTIKIWFCFPANYNIGMSSLGFLNLFSILDRNENVKTERIFYDTKKTLYSQNDIDLISFSMSFEFDFIAIFEMLKKYKLPILSSQRDESMPLIMGGGAVLTANPEPFCKMFDFIIIGDGENILPQIVNIFTENKTLPKKEKLNLLSQIKGIYVPTLTKFKNIKRNIYKFDNCVYSPIVTENTAFSKSFLIEVTRGCPYNCNFCLTSHINTPVHYSSLNSMIKAINLGLSYCNNIGLLGALVPSNPYFEDLCQYILDLRQKQEFKVSIGSLRADFITPLNINMLTQCGQKTATIAIEAGSQRMRDFINKKLTEEEILQAVDTCYSNGLDGLKVYAMIGFPTETENDIDELITLLKKMKQNKKLTLSINSFVPKTQTPFANMKMENIKTLEKKLNYIKKECLKSAIAFRPNSLAWNEIQGIISTGSRNLFTQLYNAYTDGSSIGAFRKNLRNI